MKAEDISVNSNRFKVFFNGDPSSNASVPWRRKVVVPGPMVEGDHELPNPWSYTVSEEEFASGVFEVYYPGTTLLSRQTGPYVNSDTEDARIFPVFELKSDAYNSALDRLNSKVRGTLDLSVSAAELGSTRRMLAVTSGLTSTIEGLAQRKLGLVKRLTREVSGRYLEWRYGWQPLLSDIYDAAEESLRYVLNQTSTIKATATLRYPEVMNKSFFVEGALWQSNVGVEGKQSCAIELVFKDTGTLSRWASLNPVSIAWELLPYSFVADWFYDVGGFLRGMETGFLYKDNFVRGYVSELGAISYQAKIDGKKYLAGADTVLSRGRYYKRAINFQRSLLTSYPLPRLPSWKAELGSSRLLSAAALLSQFLNYSPQKDPRTPRRQSARGGFGKSYWEKRASDLLLRNGLVR